LVGDTLFHRTLRRQKYQLVGGHSAVKKCRWLHMSLTRGRPCYKERFYGIESHRCIQMTPCLICDFRCLFCWRTHPEDLGLTGDVKADGWDEPELIVEESIRAQRRILSGYKSHVLKGLLEESKYIEALNPRHAAISLDGEPTLYPMLGELIRGYSRRGFTTFLVTNGSNPEALNRLEEEPTQLYLSLYAPDEERFKILCRPLNQGAWRRVRESLGILRDFRSSTVVRLTLVKGLNMEEPHKYAELLGEAEPTYVEAKAYMYVGYSRRRLGYDAMPSYDDVKGFAESLARETGYNLIASSEESRVVLLSRLKAPRRLREPVGNLS
jgi:tRNA wybutosine-synthesizing protein 1